MFTDRHKAAVVAGVAVLAIGLGAGNYRHFRHMFS